MKDNFSANSHHYARYRPHYPQELFDFLRQLLQKRERAWDCGTGNGQVAGKLADFFEEVYATDISTRQLMNAIDKPNVRYTKQRAENTNFPDSAFDLITVAQAIHWFDFEKFYAEVGRTLKTGGYLAVIGYSLFRSNTGTNQVIDHFYRNIVGPYWDPERVYLDEEYKTIPFPLEEVEVPAFRHRMDWSLERLVGYLNTWSAVKHFINEKGKNPVDLIQNDLKESFGNRGVVEFPILFRLGKLQ